MNFLGRPGGSIGGKFTGINTENAAKQVKARVF